MIDNKATVTFENYARVHEGIKSTYSKEVFERQCRGYQSVYGDFLPQDRNAKILDFGCGTGDFLYFLKKFGYANCYGVDASRQNVDFVRMHITENVEWCGGLKHLKNKAGYYDAIICNDVLEHIPKDFIVQTVKSIYNALRPGGTLILRVPNMENPAASYQRWACFTHTIGFTQTSLKQVAKMGGFTNVRIYPFEARKRTLRRYFKKTAQYPISVFIHLFFQCPKYTYLFHRHIMAVAVK